MHLTSYRKRLLTVFIVFGFAATVLIFFNSIYFRQKDEILRVGRDLSKMHVLLLETVNLQNDFFNHEKNNALYFRTSKSTYLTTLDSLREELRDQLYLWKIGQDESGFHLEKELISLEKNWIRVNQKFDSAQLLLFKRGFYDFGVEGDMRKYAHELEENTGIDRGQVLSLRRREKDYIIREDPSYIEMFKRELLALRKAVDQKELSPSSTNTLAILDNYMECFLEIVTLDRQLGLSNRTGMIGQLDEEVYALKNSMSNLQSKAANRQEALFSTYRNNYFVLFGLVAAVSIFLSLFFSRKMTEPIRRLSSYMSSFVSSNFTTQQELPMQYRKDEIGELAKNFKVLETELLAHVNHFKEKVEERTKELEHQKKEVEQSNLLIQAQNKDIIDSILYAQHIQNAILQKKSTLEDRLLDYFLLYKPKDIVSGDFYWTYQVKNSFQNRLYFAVGDCTGHGVPGAFMSILGINTLNEVMRTGKATYPREILVQLNRKISESLNQVESQGLKNGMDLSLVMIDIQEQNLYYSGAARPMFYSLEEEVLEVKGDMSSISGYLATEDYVFDQTVLPLNEVDNVYLFSDGYVDQFGGPKGKKFKKKTLKEVLSAVQNQPLHSQELTLLDTLNNWMGDIIQVDDICLMGVNTRPFRRHDVLSIPNYHAIVQA